MLIYDPYLDVMGGGERYAFAVGEVLAERADVVVASPSSPPVAALEAAGLTPPGPLLDLAPEGFSAASADFDIAVVVANYLPSRSRARRSFAIVQFPFLRAPRHPKRWRERLVLRQYKLLVYSEFCRRWTAERWRRPSTIVSPPVQRGSFDPDAKEQSILAVGRFFVGEHTKRHDALLRAYAQLPSTVRDAWSLTLVGRRGVRPQDHRYVEAMAAMATDVGARVLVDADPETLASCYRGASIFWHAAGYGRAADAPEQAEHFGWSTLEAMSFGAVPVVYGDGGQLEIVDAANGVLWATPDELVRETVSLIDEPARRDALGRRALASTERFAWDRFRSQVLTVFGL